MPDRHGLVIDGNGSTFKALTVGVYNRSNWRILAGSNITLENMTVRGANPHAGTGSAAYDTRFEWQHGYEFQATQGGTLYNVQAYDVYGDFVEAQEDGRLGGYVSPPARNIVVASSHFERSGRMGVGLTDIDGFVLRNSYMSDVRWDAVDVEPGAAQMAGRNVQVLNNTFRAINFAVLSNFGAGGSNVANITVTGNTQMGAPLTCDPPVWVSSPPGLYRSGYTVSNNTFVSYGNGVDVTRVNSLNVSGNVISFSPGQCSSWAGVNLVDAHSVTVSNNTFRQASTLIQEDAASSSVTSYNNTTG